MTTVEDAGDELGGDMALITASEAVQQLVLAQLQATRRAMEDFREQIASVQASASGMRNDLQHERELQSRLSEQLGAEREKATLSAVSASAAIDKDLRAWVLVQLDVQTDRYIGHRLHDIRAQHSTRMERFQEMQNKLIRLREQTVAQTAALSVVPLPSSTSLSLAPPSSRNSGIVSEMDGASRHAASTTTPSSLLIDTLKRVSLMSVTNPSPFYNDLLRIYGYQSPTTIKANVNEDPEVDDGAASVNDKSSNDRTTDQSEAGPPVALHASRRRSSSLSALVHGMVGGSLPTGPRQLPDTNGDQPAGSSAANLHNSASLFRRMSTWKLKGGDAPAVTSKMN